MLFINYKGDTPQQRYYSLGVKGNHNANIVRFIVARQQADIDLTDYVCSLKIENKEVGFKDLVMLELVKENESELTFEWVMTNKDTQFRNLELQLEFLGGDEENSVVWQTLIVELELNDTIKVGDERPTDKELSVLKQMEKEVGKLHIEIEDMKTRKIWKEVVVEYNEQHNYTSFMFPRGVMPIFWRMSEVGLLYFDYYNQRVLNTEGEEISGVFIHFDDSANVYVNFDNANYSNYDLYDGGEIEYILSDYDDDNHSSYLNGYTIIHPITDKTLAKGYMSIFTPNDKLNKVYDYWKKYRYILGTENYLTFVVMESSTTDALIVSCEFDEENEYVILRASSKNGAYYAEDNYNTLMNLTINNILGNFASFQVYAYQDQLDNYVKLTGNQTINGSKTFVSGVLIGNNKLKISRSGNQNRMVFSIDNLMKMTIDADYITTYRPIYTFNDDSLGRVNYEWNDIYLKGAIKNKNATNGIVIPDMTDWTADKHIATLEDIPNIENGVGTNSLQQKRDTTSVNFTGRNPNAEALDPTLSATFDTGASGEESITINGNTMAFSKRSFANGNKTIAKGEESHAEGYQSVSLGDGSHAEGSQTTSKGLQSHSEGGLTQAIGDGSHAEGHSTIAGGHYSHSEGSSTKIGNYAQESGIGADQSSGGGGGGDTPDPDPSYVASAGEGSHAEGYNSVIKAYGSHAEGVKNYVDGNYSHAEGVNNTLTGKFAHAEGFNNINTGECSHIEGVWNTNSGYGAFVGGYNNTNTKAYKFVFGYYNENKNNTLLEVGNGNEGARKNAFEVYEDGHAEVDLMGSTNKSVATKKYVDDNKSNKQVLGQATLSYDSGLNYYKMTLNIPKATLKQYDILVFTMANSYVYFGVSQTYDESHSVGSFLNTSTGNYMITRVGLYMSANSCEVRFGTEYNGGSNYSSLGGAIVGIKL